MSECRICGNTITDEDDLVEVDGSTMHDQCVRAHHGQSPRKVGLWAAMGAQGQMAMGAVQRGN